MHEYYISLADTILNQNVLDLGQLLSIGVTTGLLGPSLSEKLAQVFKALFYGWSLATLLAARTVN